jgi:hypothetical protein
MGWILESSYHADDGNDDHGGRYFMRMQVKADSLPFHLAEFRERFSPLARRTLDGLADQRFGSQTSSGADGQQAGALPLRPSCARWQSEGTRHRDPLRDLES